MKKGVIIEATQNSFHCKKKKWGEKNWLWYGVFIFINILPNLWQSQKEYWDRTLSPGSYFPLSFLSSYSMIESITDAMPLARALCGGECKQKKRKKKENEIIL